MNLYQMFGPGTFAVIERKLARSAFVDGAELALVLRNNPDAVLPPVIREYMVLWLEGKVKPPRGRKRGGVTKAVRDALAWVFYEQYLAEFQRQAADRRSRNGKKPRRQPPPHHLAAERVAGELFPNHTAAYVLNLVSKHR